MDLTGTTVTGSALAAATVGTVDLTFTMDLVSPDGDWVDGFMLTLPAGLSINSATMTGAYGSYPAYGQVCENIPTPLITGRTIFWGDSSRSAFGCIEGDIVFTVNVDLFTFPTSIDYYVYDDGYGGNIVDAFGTVTLTELGYEFKTEKHWNLLNVSEGDTLFEDMTVMNGTDLYTGEIHTTLAAPQVDGFQINVAVNYAAPEDFTDLDDVGTGSYDIDSYAYSGWAATALCSDPDVWTCGSSDINLLQRDIELRFTGVYADPETTIVGVDTLIVHPIEEGTGSMATFVGSRNWDTGDHPMNPTPGSDENFAIRIPFEVWDIDADGGPAQIDFLIYDRLQVPAESGNWAGDFYAFNPYDRMYCYILHRAYSVDTAAVAAVECDAAADAEYLTWNLVFWETDWVIGDVITIQYDNPIQLGSDVFAFGTGDLAPTEDDLALEKAAVEKINVFPNPYYGFHALETARQSKWVKFTHLPDVANIRIFNLGGTMVKVIRKDDATQYAQWNLKNQSGYPVASGIYIVHIEMPDLDMSKILKLAIVQEEQILTRY
jgi:hypothetical protein